MSYSQEQETEQENLYLTETQQKNSEKSSTTTEIQKQSSQDTTETTTSTESQAYQQIDYTTQLNTIQTQITGIQQIGVVLAGILVICALYRYFNRLIA